MNPNLPDFPTLVETHLFWGRDRAVKIATLAEDMKVHRSTIEHAIEKLRARGRPICSSSSNSGGVWLSMDERELIAQYRSLRARYIHQAVNARELLRTAKRFAKQKQTTLPWIEAA